MNRIWSITRYEYWRHIRRRAFLVVALGIPLLIVGSFASIVVVVSRLGVEHRLGLVDQSGRFTAGNVAVPGARQTIPVEQFADEQTARAAFRSRAIDAYVVIPEDYLRTGKIRMVGRRSLSERAEVQIRGLLEQGILATVPENLRDRLQDPALFSVRTLDGTRVTDAEDISLLFMPYAFALWFFMTTFTTSGYLLQAIAEEKEDRVIEIMATTVSARQMMAGKIIGLSAVGLTQSLIWGLLALLAVLTFGRNASELANLIPPASLLAVGLLYFVLGYLLIAASYTMIGAAVTSPQEAQPLVTPVSLLALSPFLLVVIIATRPNGLVAVILSLVPFSAPITMLMRLPVADVPAWQIIASLSLLLLSTIGTVLLSARVMRLGMLRFGKRLSISEVLSAKS